MASRTRRRLLVGATARALRRPKATLSSTDQPGKAGVLLEHDADAVRDVARDRPALELDACPALGDASPAISSSSVDLPQPDGPDDGEELALAQLEIDRPERVQPRRRRRGREDLGDAAQRDMCCRHALIPGDASFFGVLMSSGRNCVSIILARSTSPVIAPTIFCTSIMRFMPSRWIWPVPQYGMPLVRLVVRLRTALRATSGSML